MSSRVKEIQQGTENPADFVKKHKKVNNVLGWALGALVIALMFLAVFLKGF